MLRQAEKLIDRRIHPQAIVDGYRMAAKVARDRLIDIAFDHEGDEEAFRANLKKIAMTTLSSKLLVHEKEQFAELAVKAILRLKQKNNLDLVQIIKKKGGSLRESGLEEGFILEKQIGVGQPKVMTDCKVMIANTPMDSDKIKVRHRVLPSVDSFSLCRSSEPKSPLRTLTPLPLLSKQRGIK